jgi:hypothetical protein
VKLALAVSAAAGLAIVAAQASASFTLRVRQRAEINFVGDVSMSPIPVGLGRIDIVIDVTGTDPALMSDAASVDVLIVDEAESVAIYSASLPAPLVETEPAASSPKAYSIIETKFGSESEHTKVSFQHEFAYAGVFRVGLKFWRRDGSYVTSFEPQKIVASDGMSRYNR